MGCTAERKRMKGKAVDVFFGEKLCSFNCNEGVGTNYYNFQILHVHTCTGGLNEYDR
ncbi:MAG: hypothetical protein ACI92E_000443 [Oceanicoccus sp.]|jgi:hypothetical protein